MKHPFRLDPEPSGQPSLEVDGHVAQSDRPVAAIEERLGHDTHWVGEVDEPGIRRRSASDQLRETQHHRHGAQGLGKAARSGRLLADAVESTGEGLVQVLRRLAADTQLDQHERRAIDGCISVSGLRHPDR